MHRRAAHEGVVIGPVDVLPPPFIAKLERVVLHVKS